MPEQSENRPTAPAPDGGALLRALFDALPGRAAFLDPELRYLFVNREFLDALGSSEDAVLGRRVGEVLGEEAAALYGGALPQLAVGEPYHGRRWIFGPDGTRRCVEEELRPFAPGGTLRGVVCVVREPGGDERARTRSDETHKAREAIHAAVVDSALDCIIVIDADGRVVEFNPAASATFGYDREQAIGKTIAELIVPPEMRESHNQGLKRFRAGGPASVLGRRVELEAQRADGARIPVELAITAVGKGASALFTAHLRDLRPARAARAEIERQKEALYQSEKLAALGSLLAGVAHELNNPLAIVLGQALMLREAAQERAELDRQFESFAERGAKIEAAANRCARIVKTFLAMARQREAERSEVKIAELIERVLDLLAYGLRTAGIEVTTDIPSTLPMILADSDQLHQVLLNLVMNAKQALEAEPTPRRLAIIVREDREAAKLDIRLCDNGPGVPDAIRTRIFEPFFTTKPQGVGTGIGLAVSRGLIEAHGGVLVLEPQRPSGGASFLIRLPIATATSAASAVAADTVPAAVAETARRRALLVDDEVEILALLGEILDRMGFDCERASSGEAAKRILMASPAAFDLVLCDIRMPNGDGPALYDWMCAEQPRAAGRIVFVTGDVLGPAAARFIARSGRPVVEKPFLPDDIRQMIELLDEAG